MPAAHRLKIRPLSKKDDLFLSSLIEELDVNNPKWTKLKLRYLFMGLEGYDPVVDEETIKELLPYTPPKLNEAKKRLYIIKSMRASGISHPPMLMANIAETIALRRRKLSAERRKDFLTEVNSLSSIIGKLQEKLDNPAVRSFFENHMEEDHYDDPKYPYRQIYKNAIRFSAQLQLTCTLVEGSHRQARGRPSHDDLVDYVAEIAKIYEKLSKKKFTILRHFDEARDEEATAITPGHRFVEKVIAWTEKQDFSPKKTNKSVFTKTNVYNACEAAQKRINA